MEGTTRAPFDPAILIEELIKQQQQPGLAGGVQLPQVAPQQSKHLPVPLVIRKKIQAMLLLKFCEGGCFVANVRDKYQDFYGESIDPKKWGYQTWKSFLKSMKDEVKVKMLNKEDTAYGVQVTNFAELSVLAWEFKEHAERTPEDQLVMDEPAFNIDELLLGPIALDVLKENLSSTAQALINQVLVSVSPPLRNTENLSTEQSVGGTVSTVPEVANESVTRTTNSPDTTVRPPKPPTVEVADTSIPPDNEQPCSSRSLTRTDPPNPKKRRSNEPEIIEVRTGTIRKIVEVYTLDDSDDDSGSNGATPNINSNTARPNVKPVLSQTKVPDNTAKSSVPACEQSGSQTTGGPTQLTTAKQKPTRGQENGKSTSRVGSAARSRFGNFVESGSVQANKAGVAVNSSMSHPATAAPKNAKGPEGTKGLPVNERPNLRTYPPSASKVAKYTAIRRMARSPTKQSSSSGLVTQNTQDLAARVGKEPAVPSALNKGNASPPDLGVQRKNDSGTEDAINELAQGVKSSSISLLRDVPTETIIQIIMDKLGPTCASTPNKSNTDVSTAASEASASTSSRTTTPALLPSPPSSNPPMKPVSRTQVSTKSVSPTKTNEKVPLGHIQAPESLMNTPPVSLTSEPSVPKQSTGSESAVNEALKRKFGCNPCWVRVKRLKKSEIPTKQQGTVGRKRKVSEITASDDESDIQLPKTPRLRSQAKAQAIPTVEDLAVLVDRPPQQWFTNKFRAAFDGDGCFSFVDYMVRTEILRPPDDPEWKEYYQVFTKPEYFDATDGNIDEELQLLETAREEWYDVSPVTCRGFYCNAVASLYFSWELGCLKSDKELALGENGTFKVPLMNFESFQIANLDADLNISDITGMGEQITIVTSYGNFADYHMWKFGNNCQCIGLLPEGAKGFAKLRIPAGISYDNFDHFEKGNVNICEPNDVDCIHQYVEACYPKLVDLYLASGIAYEGSSLEGPRSQDLALAQSLSALLVVREGGTFVLKVEDTFTDFSVGLIFYLSRCFNYLTIVKPVSALPRERFVVCREKRPKEKYTKIIDFLMMCHGVDYSSRALGGTEYADGIFGSKDGQKSVHLACVDPQFLLQIRKWNSELSYIERKEYDLFCLTRYYWQQSTADSRSALQNAFKRIRDQYLLSWNLVKDSASTVAVPVDLPPSVSELAELSERTIYQSLAVKGSSDARSWKCIPTGTPAQRHLIYANPDHVYKWDEGLWKPIEGFTLPARTVLYAEIFPASKSRPSIISIIDVKQWAGLTLDDKPYNERIGMCKNLTSQIDNPKYWVTYPKVYQITGLPPLLFTLHANKKFNKSYFQSLDDKMSANTKNAAGGTQEFNFCVTGILFLQDENPDGSSSFHNFSEMIRDRLLWEWKFPTQLGGTAENLRVYLANLTSRNNNRNTTSPTRGRQRFTLSTLAKLLID